MDWLEARTLMATAPTAVVGNWTQITQNAGTFVSDDSSPYIAVDPINPLKMVEGSTNRSVSGGTTFISQQAAYSIDGGKSWNPLSLPGNLGDTSKKPPVPFTIGKVEGVAFDNKENVYVGVFETNAAPTGNAGAVVVDKYNFAQSSPQRVSLNNVAYYWDQTQTGQNLQAAIENFSMAVDTSQASYTDPASNRTNSDPNSGHVYIAWTTNAPPAPNVTPWNPYSIQLVGSPDGVNWSAKPITMDGGNFFNNQRDTSPTIAINQGRPGTVGGDVTVVFDDFGSGANAVPPVDYISDTVYSPSQNTILASSIVAVTTVRGAADAPYPLTSPISPIGIGPSPAVAVDNTLGSFTAHPGRLYVTYVDRYNFDTKNPADNTDIFLSYSDDGGGSWSAPQQVNSDNGIVDGHTGAVNLNDPNTLANHPDGRPQFEPTIAVDPATGTVAMAWLDGRDDPTRSRYAYYLTTSIDGGQTFSPNVYANRPDLVTDAVTGNSVAVAPYLGSGADEASMSFGEHQGLAIGGGLITPVWSTTPYDGLDVNPFSFTFLQPTRLSIATAQATYPYGPRVLSATSGAVQSTTVDSVQFDLSAGSVLDSFNSFTLNFDQPVPVGIFDAAAVQFDQDGTGTLPGSIPVGSVRAVGAVNGMATQFVVSLQAAPVTHAVYTAIVTLALPAPTGAPLGPQVTSAQVTSANNITFAGSRLAAHTFDNTLSADHTQQADGFLVNFDRPVSIASFNPAQARVFFHDAYGDPALALLVTQVVPIDAALYYDGTSEAEQFMVRFAPPPSASVRTPVGSYTYGVGPNVTDLVRTPPQLGLIPDSGGPYAGSSQDTPIPFPAGGQATSSINIASAPSKDIVTGLTVRVSVQFAHDANLTISLISPTGNTIVLASGVGGGGANFTNTLFSDSAPIGIGAGSAPFSSPTGYRPQQALSNLFGDSVDGGWTLNVTDNATGALTGSLLSWSISLDGAQNTLSTVGTGNAMDQNVNGVAGEPTDVFTNPASVNGVPFAAPYDTATLPIVVPGPHLAGTFVPGATKTADNLVTNNTVGYLDLTFDRNMNPATIVGTYAVTAAGAGGPIVSMIGPAGPIYGTFVVTADPQAGEDPAHPRTFRIAFPSFQQYSGTYTVNLAASITSQAGDKVDSTLRAGVALLFGTPAAGATAVDTTYASAQVPVAIVPGAPALPSVVTSTIQVGDSYAIYKDLYLTLNITYPNDPDLSATLTAPDGKTVINLFTAAGNIGAAGTRQNFTNTILDDNSTASIETGSPPFNGRYLPQQPFSQLLTGTFPVNGTWTLTIKNSSVLSGSRGTLTGWSLTFGRPSALDTGLGDPVADRSTAGFRIFTMDPTNTLASNTWTAVGPASNNGGYNQDSHVWLGNSSRIGAIALDPTDPSGNTAFVAGASGGVWKTTDFLTTDPQGPTYVPLTTISPVYSMNIGSIAVFGRNNDPSQSIVVAATGEGSTSSPGPQGGGGTSIGVGFLISYNGGQSWTLMDSTSNVDAAGKALAIGSPLRDHAFVGSTSYKVVVDPHPQANGNVIIYAALSGKNGGVWRSLDSGRTWMNMKAGDATDLVLDPVSRVDAVSNPTGNLRTVYASFRGAGVFLSPNQGQTWNLMAGGVGDPLIQDALGTNRPITVNAPPDTPGGAKARIVLGKPALTGNPILDVQYETWLYAAVVTPDQNFNGLYVTKDNGQNWTKVLLPTAAFDLINGFPIEVVPTNDITQPQYNLTRGQGDYDLALAVDPLNPEVVYVGGTRDFQPSTMIRVDITRLADPHALFTDPTRNGGGAFPNTTSPVTIKPPLNQLVAGALDPVTGLLDPDPLFNPYLNLYRNPNNPFGNNSTVSVTNTQAFTNDGSGAFWTPFETFLNGYTDIHQILAMVDPATGKSRLIVGLDQGVFTGLSDGSGNLITSIGNQATVTGSRNGNLQINQFYNGAVQPSDVANAVAQAMFYGMAQDNGFPQSDPNILSNGNLNWTGIAGDGTDVAVDQTGSGTSYFSKWPCCINDGSAPSDFFKVRPYGPASVETGRTFGLIQTAGTGGGNGGTGDPQWPAGPSFNFAVNPIAPNQMVIGSGAGRLFGTESQGEIWYVLADPSTFDSTTIPALAYGAPDPNGPGNPQALDNYIVVGTTGGHIYATFTAGGGGGAPNAWINISNGLADNASIERIVTDPTRGTHDAYAISTDHVYYNANTAAANTAWVDVTGDLFKQTFTPLGDPNFTATELQYLQGLAVDWRYVIPNNPALTNGPTHPMLYVAGEGGVYRSTNGGVNWTLFPDASLGTAAAPTLPQGNLPSAHVTDLDLALGDVNPTTGHPVLSGLVAKLDGSGKPVIDPATGLPVLVQQTGPNVLVATTYGRGSYAIRLAPIVFEDGTNNVGLSSTLPAPSGSDTGKYNNDGITNDTVPFISGLSEQTAFGNKVAVTLYLVGPGGTTTYLGGFDPGRGSPTDDGSQTYSFNNAANETDAFGQFNVQVAPGLLAGYNGVVHLEVVATDQAGTRGNVVPYQFTLLTKIPAATSAPTLDPASDSGPSNSDGYTKDNVKPVFDVAPTVDNAILLLFRRALGSNAYTQVGTANVPIGTPPGTPPALTTIVDATSPLVPQGTYYYATEIEDLAGNISPMSPDSKPITYDTTPPAQTAAPVLDPASDSGAKGDGITKFHNLSFDVTGGEAAPTLTILLQGTLADGSDAVQVASIGGNGVIADPNNLADGTYYFFTEQEDLAGNFSSPLSAGTPVQVISLLTQPPPTIALLPTDDSSGGRDVTNVKQPHFYGVAPVPPAPPAAGYTITLYDETNAASPVNLVSIPDPNTGNYIIQTPAALKDGTYKYAIVVSDVAGNTEMSNVVTFTIKTSVPTSPPALDIVPTDVVPPAITPANTGRTTVRRPRLEGYTDPGAIVKLYLSTGTLEATATATTTPSGGHRAGYFTVQLPFNLSDGTVQVYATETDLANNSSGAGPTFTLNITTAPFDFNNSGRADIGVFHPSTATWYISLPGGQQLIQPFGYPNHDIPVSGDYVGDGSYDLAVFRPMTDQWFITSPTRGLITTQYGWAGHDTPVPAGYDTVGQSEVAVYRPGTGQWFILHNIAQGGGSQQIVSFGFANLDLPVPADYAGAGYAELAVYRPTTGDWIFDDQKTGAMSPIINLGHQAGDIPVPGDYDNIGRAEPALYRPGTGQFIVYNPTINKIYTVKIGASAADVPVPADYTGSGHTDFAVYTPATAVWTYIDPIANKVVRVNYGANNVDVPIEAPFSYRAALSSTGSPVGVPGGGGIGGGGIPFNTEGPGGRVGSGGGGGIPNLVLGGAGTPAATFGSAPAPAPAGRSATAGLTSSGKSSGRPNVAAPATPKPLSFVRTPATSSASSSPADLALDSLGTPIRGKFVLA